MIPVGLALSRRAIRDSERLRRPESWHVVMKYSAGECIGVASATRTSLLQLQSVNIFGNFCLEHVNMDVGPSSVRVHLKLFLEIAWPPGKCGARQTRRHALSVADLRLSSWFPILIHVSLHKDAKQQLCC